MLFLLALLLAGCVRPAPEGEEKGTASALIAGIPTPPVTPQNGPPTPARATPTLALAGSAQVPASFPTYAGTPTPDPTRAGAAEVAASLSHVVASGETLGAIAQFYQVSLEELMASNNLGESDFLIAGQTLLIPTTPISATTPSFKIIPDSELVYGPGAAAFDVAGAVAAYGGFLAHYSEEVEGQTLSGAEIVQLVADRFRVNPRLLLAVLEHRAGWVTRANAATTVYLLGFEKPAYEGLYQQLGLAADWLNRGYYGLQEGGLVSLQLDDGQWLRLAPDINAGTAGVQLMLGAHQGATYNAWLDDVGPAGLFATYSRLFGNPFAYTVDPLWPPGLAQPALRLPWSPEAVWYFTGGPHGGWASGSAWAALDFVPFGEQLGCYQAADWVLAVADGVVARSGFGAVVLDLDGDGDPGSGWAVVYQHIASEGRIAAGSRVQAGEPLGHPSCEGGFANGTHIHIARTYNGRWVSADGPLPFVMDGWTSQGLGREYDGLLVKGELVKEACECREFGNAITDRAAPEQPGSQP